MDARTQFVGEYLKGELSMTELCRFFSISRRTGYKWVGRYAEEGASGLHDRSRAAHSHPNAVSGDVATAIVNVRRAHRTWGPKKVLAWLREHDEKRLLPAVSTAGDILDRHGLVQKRVPKRRSPPRSRPIAQAKRPNDVWCADHKGHFKTGNGTYCYPTTITDEHSRFLLACRGAATYDWRATKPAFEQAFREYGLPEVIRSDNGSPFATKLPHGLSRLSVWWLRLGILHDRIDPGHPEQNGIHERMHRTLKAETTKPPAKDLRRQQRIFDVFRDEFNSERPHEALGLRAPSRFFTASPRQFTETPPPFEYPDTYRVRLVTEHGRFRWPGRYQITVGTSLGGEYVGCLQKDDDLWEVYLGPLLLGLLDIRRLADGLIRVDRTRPE